MLLDEPLGPDTPPISRETTLAINSLPADVDALTLWLFIIREGLSKEDFDIDASTLDVVNELRNAVCNIPLKPPAPAQPPPAPSTTPSPPPWIRGGRAHLRRRLVAVGRAVVGVPAAHPGR